MKDLALPVGQEPSFNFHTIPAESRQRRRRHRLRTVACAPTAGTTAGEPQRQIYSVTNRHALTIKPYCHPFSLLGLANRNHKGVPRCVASFPTQAHSCLGSFLSQVPWIYTSVLGLWSQAPSTGRSRSSGHLLPGSQACLGWVFSLRFPGLHSCQIS